MMKLQADKESDAAKLQGQIYIEQMRIQADKEKTQMQIAADMEKARIEAMSEKEDNSPKVILNANDAINDVAQTLRGVATEGINTMAKSHDAIVGHLAAMANTHNAPKKIVLDNGRTATVSAQ